MALTAEPAGTVATRLAGLAGFRAVLEWEEAVPRPPHCIPVADAHFRHDLAQTISPCGARLEVRGTVRALTARGLAAALENLMRGVADAAAVSGAVLEMRVLREAPPRPVDAVIAQALAKDLWRAGFAVRLAPCWEPVGFGGLALGAQGGEEGLREFLREHRGWSAS